MHDLVAPGSETPIIAEWDRALDDPNLEDAHIPHKLAALLERVEDVYRRTFRHKSWQYMTASSDEVFVAFVVGTAGFAGNGFVYAVETRTGRVHEKFAIAPLALGTTLAPSSTAGTHRFANRKLTVEIDNHDRGRSFVARAHADGIAIDLAYTCAPTDEHHAQCVPLAGGRWNYTHKFGAFRVDGTVTLGDRRQPGAARRIAIDHGFGTLDFTKMYALRHAVWRWIAFAGRTTAGKVIGVNLVDPTPDAEFSENAVWIDGKRTPLFDVAIQATASDRWNLAADGLEIGMRAIAKVEQKLDVPLVRHHLQHVVGRFTGRVIVDGETHEIADLVGIAEDNDTWW